MLIEVIPENETDQVIALGSSGSELKVIFIQLNGKLHQLGMLHVRVVAHVSNIDHHVNTIGADDVTKLHVEVVVFQALSNILTLNPYVVEGINPDKVDKAVLGFHEVIVRLLDPALFNEPQVQNVTTHVQVHIVKFESVKLNSTSASEYVTFCVLKLEMTGDTESLVIFKVLENIEAFKAASKDFALKAFDHSNKGIQLTE